MSRADAVRCLPHMLSHILTVIMIPKRRCLVKSSKLMSHRFGSLDKVLQHFDDRVGGFFCDREAAGLGRRDHPIRRPSHLIHRLGIHREAQRRDRLPESATLRRTSTAPGLSHNYPQSRRRGTVRLRSVSTGQAHRGEKSQTPPSITPATTTQLTRSTTHTLNKRVNRHSPHVHFSTSGLKQGWPLTLFSESHSPPRLGPPLKAGHRGQTPS